MPASSNVEPSVRQARDEQSAKPVPAVTTGCPTGGNPIGRVRIVEEH
jgi:hypothetical protein